MLSSHLEWKPVMVAVCIVQQKFFLLDPIVRVNAANHDGYVKTSHRFPQYPMLGLNSRLATCLYGYWTVPCISCV